ncbi:hypothetical protein CU254_23280 [Amycolatopsis sp. AA4]|nr:hypothetical protein CU254_23280 [Amycolatopsis sp. AA4]
MVGAEPRLEMKQRAHRPVLIVMAVGAGQVPVEAAGQQVRVPPCAEPDERGAESLARATEFARQQQLADQLAVLFAAVEPGQPGRSQSTMAPSAGSRRWLRIRSSCRSGSRSTSRAPEGHRQYLYQEVLPAVARPI